MKKPVLHILLRGYDCRSEDTDSQFDISLLQPSTVGKVPTICTSHQLFHELCTEADGDGHKLPETIRFQVHQYSLNPFAPLLAVRLCPGSKFFEFQAKKPKQQRRSSKEMGTFWQN